MYPHDGGGVVKPKHFAATIIRRINPKTGRRQVLVVHYHPVLITEEGRRIKRGFFQIKFPGGTQKFSETPKETARREAGEETGLIVRGLQKVCEIKTNDGPQLYFLAELARCKGKLRKAGKEDGRADLDEPLWVDENKVGTILYGKHKKAFVEYEKSGQ